MNALSTWRGLLHAGQRQVVIPSAARNLLSQQDEPSIPATSRCHLKRHSRVCFTLVGRGISMSNLAMLRIWPRGKRDFLAKCSGAVGILSLLERLPKRRVLVVLTYHRIGDASKTPYDPGVFSVTGDELDLQLAYLKRHFHIVALNEATDLVTRGFQPGRAACLLITFDDGYLDNYTEGFPVLRSHGVPGTFFLPTSFVGTDHLPWWDHIAYVVRHARKLEIRLEYPRPCVFDTRILGADTALVQVLELFKEPQTIDRRRFLKELNTACGVEAVPQDNSRRFMNWDEAREMQRAGMDFGSHSESHEMLSKLSPEQELQELTRSQQIMRSELGCRVEALAYPVGSPAAFSPRSAQAAQHCGYRIAFSQYGGLNRLGHMDPYNVLRVAMQNQTPDRLRLQAGLAGIAGSDWF